MLPTAKKIHTPLPLLEKIPILIVSPHADDYSSVRQILRNDCWQIDATANLEEAAKYLQQSVASVIICERDLPDGTWMDVLQKARDLQPFPSILVVSRHADENLWAEVLNSGGYDVLPKPFERREAVRIISMAWRHCQAKNAPRKPASSEQGPTHRFVHAVV
jgi:DNA-binding NtrC family response regulator